jgi:hypothetical protein
MEQKKIAAAFVGHFVSLGAHVIGARTVESILQIYAPKFTRGLKAEFYGSVSHLIIVACDTLSFLSNLKHSSFCHFIVNAVISSITLKDCYRKLNAITNKSKTI